MKKITIVVLVLISVKLFGQVRTYDFPGGEEFRSPDYEISIIQGSDTLKSFVYYSYGLDSYTSYNWDGSFNQNWTYNHVAPESHSSAIFSFNGTVTVRVKVLSFASEISLPLKSAKVLPSSYGIECTIVGKDIIEFELDSPEKVVVIPNYDEAWNVYVQKSNGHIPIDSWKDDYNVERKRSSYHGTNLTSYLTEGYRNPLFIFGHAEETDVPDKNDESTLVVKPGASIDQITLYTYKTIWFEPGIHDLSHWGTNPYNHVDIKKGQTFYLEGGSYVKARITSNTSGTEKSTIKGRGVLSGIDHAWILNFETGSQIVNVDIIKGITITDRGSFSIYGGHYIGDVALIGAWHGNTDGPDYTDNCLIEKSFLMAYDDNLKLNNNTDVRHCVIWQGPNAHAIMVKETFRDQYEGIHLFANSTVEDIDIIGYFPGTDWNNPWPQLSRAAISIVTAMDILITNFTFKDIRIESPYLSRVLNIYNLNTNEINPGWFNTTSENYHSRIDGITFENISINAPVICYEALLGSGYSNSFKNVSLENFNINGVTITPENIEDYFEIEYKQIENLVVSGKTVTSISHSATSDTPFFIENYPNPFNASTRIRFSINTTSQVDVNVYNIMGQRVAKLMNKILFPGEHQINWTPENLSSGFYIIKIFTDSKAASIKTIYLK